MRESHYVWTVKAEQRARSIMDYDKRQTEIRAGNAATFHGKPIPSEMAELWLIRGLIERKEEPHDQTRP